jgi:hypothetical protein
VVADSKMTAFARRYKSLARFSPILNSCMLGGLLMKLPVIVLKGLFDRTMCVWINFTPPFLVDIVAKDCNPTILSMKLL